MADAKATLKAAPFKLVIKMSAVVLAARLRIARWCNPG